MHMFLTQLWLLEEIQVSDLIIFKCIRTEMNLQLLNE